jgi:hypothetical protein
MNRSTPGAFSTPGRAKRGVVSNAIEANHPLIANIATSAKDWPPPSLCMPPKTASRSSRIWQSYNCSLAAGGLAVDPSNVRTSALFRRVRDIIEIRYIHPNTEHARTCFGAAHQVPARTRDRGFAKGSRSTRGIGDVSIGGENKHVCAISVTGWGDELCGHCDSNTAIRNTVICVGYPSSWQRGLLLTSTSGFPVNGSTSTPPVAPQSSIGCEAVR